jgi:sec-independent protein translocase protein TatA
MCDSVVEELTLLALWSPGPSEMMVLAAVALLLYGGKLPEVARSWGKTFAEFRRSLSGIQNDLNDAIYHEPQKLEYQPEPTSYSDYSDDSLYDPADKSEADLENAEPENAGDSEEGSQEEAPTDDALSEGDSAAPKRD